MDKSVDKSIGERLAAAMTAHGFTATEISRRLGAEYTALSHFHCGRRPNLPGGIPIERYVALLEEMTGKSAADLGIADLKRAKKQGAAA